MYMYMYIVVCEKQDCNSFSSLYDVHVHVHCGLGEVNLIIIFDVFV